MDKFPDPTAILAAMRTAKDRWINDGIPDDAIWELVEAFETLDLLLLEGGDLPEDWKAPEQSHRHH